jgi:hypothetical protein
VFWGNFWGRVGVFFSGFEAKGFLSDYRIMRQTSIRWFLVGC